MFIIHWISTSSPPPPLFHKLFTLQPKPFESEVIIGLCESFNDIVTCQFSQVWDFDFGKHKQLLLHFGYATYFWLDKRPQITLCCSFVFYFSLLGCTLLSCFFHHYQIANINTGCFLFQNLCFKR